MRQVKIFLLLVIFIPISKIHTQGYNTAIGINIGDQFTFSAAQRLVKHYSLEAKFNEGLFSDYRHLSLTARRHQSFITKDINTYLGGGLYGQTNLTQHLDSKIFNYKNYGLKIAIGAEANFKRINIGVDLGLYYALQRSLVDKKYYFDPSVSIRYILWQRQTLIGKIRGKLGI